ncbi:pantetheine-phosphate adenylyltransferase [Elusimicrobium posterum]|uniref:pantetheine-phosphate adenylyltransferase n=1 Tax=Elusimicrobium posterum TaxID=3116653 RepID=UPI003C749262
MSKKIAIYPGTFDPVTNGHMDLIERSLDIFDEVVVAVLVNSSKAPLFTKEERVQMLAKCCAHLKGVRVDSFEGLLVDYLKTQNCNVVLRGLRMATDLEYEFQLSTVNNMLDPEIDTVFLMPAAKNIFLTSSIIREAYAGGGKLPACVPPNVHEELLKKFNK